MFSPIMCNAFFLLFAVWVFDWRYNEAEHCHSLISCDLIRTTLVSLELISVRDGAFCLHQFDDFDKDFDGLYF